MSLRTTPLWLTMSAPFEPSPGCGPAVSSGIVSQSVVAVVVVDASVVSAEESPQPASPNTPSESPAAPTSRTSRPRVTIVSRSNASRWSIGSSGFVSRRPSKVGAPLMRPSVEASV
jgi:hypothetical protein